MNIWCISFFLPICSIQRCMVFQKMWLHKYSVSIFILLYAYVYLTEFPWRGPRPQQAHLTWRPAWGRRISWLAEGQPGSRSQRSSAWGLAPRCSKPEETYRRGFAPGSPCLPRGGDREPGRAPGFSTWLGLFWKREELSVIFIEGFGPKQAFL